MTLISIPQSAIVPPEINGVGAVDVIFLYFNYPGGTVQLLNQLTRHIHDMDRHLVVPLETKLALQLRLPSMDSHGNVCFADDPHLRPEFRTTFQARDIWDYYYAMWHSEVYWSRKSDNYFDLPLPQPEIFWPVVAYGQKLREIQTLKSGDKGIQISWRENQNKIIEPMDNRFRKTHPDDQVGKLFLNKELFLSRVPNLAWEYRLSALNPLKRWIEQNTNQAITQLQIQRLSQMVSAVAETVPIQDALDILFRRK